MTGPRPTLDSLKGPGAQSIAKLLGLTLADGAPASSAPAPMDIPGTEQEMANWRQRGGMMDPADARAIGAPPVQYPGGQAGGPFSDQEFAAYLDAAKKLGFAKGMAHLKPLIDAHGRMTPANDATATKRPKL